MKGKFVLKTEAQSPLGAEQNGTRAGRAED